MLYVGALYGHVICQQIQNNDQCENANEQKSFASLFLSIKNEGD